MIDRPADYDPPAWHRVCSRHFVGGIMTAQNNIPELFHKNNFKQPLSERPDSSIKKRQILAAIKPSQRKRELKFQNKGMMCCKFNQYLYMYKNSKKKKRSDLKNILLKTKKHAKS